MNGSFRRFLASIMVVALVLLYVPTVSLAAGGPAYKTYKMGQVEVCVSASSIGTLGTYNIFVNLNGYRPQTVYSVIKGDFTEEEIRESAILRGEGSLSDVASLVTDVRLYDAVVTDAESMYEVMNGGARSYQRNTYRVRDLTSITYSIMWPGDQPARGLHIAGSGHSVKLMATENDNGLRKTTHYVYMDGKLIFEFTLNAEGVIVSYDVRSANFQMSSADSPIPVEPITSRLYVGGEQIDLEAYLINGNSYIRLRDIAYVLKDTPAKFNVVWHQDDSLIEMKCGSVYVPDGSELGGLPTGMATISESQIICEYEEESYSHPDSHPWKRPYTNLHTEQRSTISPNGKEYSRTIYIATYAEYFRPVAYCIGGNDFYKLSDIAQIASFAVDWDEGTDSMRIVTAKSMG